MIRALMKLVRADDHHKLSPYPRLVRDDRFGFVFSSAGLVVRAVSERGVGVLWEGGREGESARGPLFASKRRERERGDACLRSGLGASGP